MNDWWVNQGFQFTQEQNLGCLWAPTTAKDGRTFSHWENVKKMQVGDRVFHYSKGLIKAYSAVVSPWEIRPRPDTKGHNNLFSSEEGYYVRVNPITLNPPIPLEAIPGHHRLPEKYPTTTEIETDQEIFDKNGNPKQGYLYPMGQALGDLLREQIGTTQGDDRSPLNPTFINFLTQWRQQRGPKILAELEKIRQEFNQRFPKEQLGQLTLENYALGNPDVNPDSFCQWIEFTTHKLGSISGGSSRKHGIYWSQKDQNYRWNKSLNADTPEAAFQSVKEAIINLVAAVERGDLDHVDQIADPILSNVSRGKPLSLYYPDIFLPIHSPTLLHWFLSYFGLSLEGGTLAQNLRLFEFLKAQPEFNDFDSMAMMRCLCDFKKGSAAEVLPRWIFQASPAYFDVDGALKQLDRLTWKVKQHQHEIHEGDRVLLWRSGRDAAIVATAIVTSEPSIMAEDPESLEFNRDASKFDGDRLRVWLEIEQVLEPPLLKSELIKQAGLEHLSIFKFAQATNFEIKAHEGKILEKLLMEHQPPPEPVPPTTLNPVYTQEQLQGDTGYDRDLLDRMIRNLERKQQIILSGAPGSGKTYLAHKLANYFLGEGARDGIRDIIQFHPAYTYEDFIQGLRPMEDQEGNLTYRVVPGRFMDFCDRARDRAGYSVLIIDEINRANLATLFGELMYLLEYRGEAIKLAATATNFSIPPQVLIIGTMNTADRSIALVDHALRRRFAFMELRPHYDVLRSWHQRRATEFDVEPLIKLLGEINQTIHDRHYEVGISFFLDEQLPQHLQDIWEMEIVPYLEEFFYDRPEVVDDFRWERVQGRLWPLAHG